MIERFKRGVSAIRSWSKAGKRAAIAACVFFAGWLSIPKPPLKDGLSWSRAVYDRQHRLLRLTLSSDEKYRQWTPIERISPLLVEATLLQEDRAFYWHPGINPAALMRAVRRTYLSAGRRVGGSTITMQLARMRFDINSKTVSGKIEQMARAIQLERHYSKKEILEAYLNLVPYGGNVEGVGAASLIYFGKPVQELVLPEALALCVIPKSPMRRALSNRPSGLDRHPGEGGEAGSAVVQENRAVISARRALFDRWVRVHPRDEAQRELLNLPLNIKAPAQLAFRAPHFVNAVLSDDPAGGDVPSTLDLPLQNLLERRARAYVERRRDSGIRNVAAMLVDYESMEVRALIGSANFFDDSISGQVNGTRARRSPGSTLKPIIYALGMQQGLLHPMTMLKDAPASFGGFNPENFDREFVGPIHARDALIRSRNIPAVTVASQLKEPTLHEFLSSAGVANLKPPEYYGMALALGAAEMPMEQLVELYAMLANFGLYAPIRVRLDQPAVAGRRLLSPESCFLVLDILKDNPRPSQSFRSDWTRDALPVHWKTGTSWAFRDAWSIGVFGHYVIAVWAGEFSGESNPAFVGVEAAAPLMFEVIDAVKVHEPGLRPAIRNRPPNLARVEVCAVSGQIPGPFCRHRVNTWFIPGRSPIKVCDIHREVLVDSRTGLRACNGSANTKSVVYEFWPSDLLRIFREAGVPRKLPPRDDPNCTISAKATRGSPPQITSPQGGVFYNVRSAAEDTVPFSAVTDADARRVYWFIDEKFVGSSGSGAPLLWKAQPGRYVVRAVDDQGRSDAREMHVALAQ